jgi:Preprotein translocase subunit Sec66
MSFLTKIVILHTPVTPHGFSPQVSTSHTPSVETDSLLFLFAFDGFNTGLRIEGSYFNGRSSATVLYILILLRVNPRTNMVDWLSLAVPFAYLGILIGSLATFSSLYRKRKAGILSLPLP